MEASLHGGTVGMLDVDVEGEGAGGFGVPPPRSDKPHAEGAMVDDDEDDADGGNTTATGDANAKDEDDTTSTSVTELQALVLRVLKDEAGSRGFTFPELVKHLQTLEGKAAAKLEASGRSASAYGLGSSVAAAVGDDGDGEGGGAAGSSGGSGARDADSPFGLTADLERLSAQVVASLRMNERVSEDTTTGRFRYSPLYAAADRFELLDLLKTQAHSGAGIGYDDSCDAYPGAAADLEALTRSGGLLPSKAQRTGAGPAGGPRYLSGAGVTAGGRHVGVVRLISERTGSTGSRVLPRLDMADEVLGGVDVSTFTQLPGRVSVVHGSFFALTTADLTGELFRNDVVVIGDRHFRVSSAAVNAQGRIQPPGGPGNSTLPPAAASASGGSSGVITGKPSYEARMITAILEAVGAQPRSETRLASKRRGGGGGRRGKRSGGGAAAAAGEEDGGDGEGGDDDVGYDDEEEDELEEVDEVAAAFLRPETRTTRSRGAVHGIFDTLAAVAAAAPALKEDAREGGEEEGVPVAEAAGDVEPAAKRLKLSPQAAAAPAPGAPSPQAALLAALVAELSSVALPATGVWLASAGNDVRETGGIYSVADTGPHRLKSHMSGYALPFTAQLLPLDRPWDGPTMTGLPAFRYGASADLRSLWRMALPLPVARLKALGTDPPKWVGAGEGRAGAEAGAAKATTTGGGSAAAGATTVSGAGLFGADGGGATGALVPTSLGAPGSGSIAILSRLGGADALRHLMPFPDTHQNLRAQMRAVGMRDSPMLPGTLAGTASTLAPSAAVAAAGNDKSLFVRKVNSRIMQARTNLAVLARNKELAEGLRRSAVTGMIEDVERKKARRDQAAGAAALNITTVGKKVEYRRVG